MIANGPSGSDAESKSGSSLGSSRDTPFPSRSSSFASSQTRETGVLERVGAVYSTGVCTMKKLFPWKGAGEGRTREVKRGVQWVL